MSDSTFQEETIRVIRHLQRKLAIIIDSAHTAKILKNVVIEYLENLIQCGPCCIDPHQNHRPPAMHKEALTRVSEIVHPFTKQNSRSPSQRMVYSSGGLNRFSTPTDRETIFHGIRIPPGCEVIELPTKRPYVRDFFFIEGNARHFISVDDRPASSNSPSNRVMFHSTCPQRSKNDRSRSRTSSNFSRPIDLGEVDDNASADDSIQHENIRRMSPLVYPTTSNHNDKIETAFGTRGTVNKCVRKNRRCASRFEDETAERYSETSVGSERKRDKEALSDRWSHNVRWTVGMPSSRADGQSGQHVRSKFEIRDPREVFLGAPSKLEQQRTSNNSTNKSIIELSDLAKVQVKAEESVSKYEKSLRKKYETTLPNFSENEDNCNRHRDSNRHDRVGVTEFEKQLNEKYATRQACGAEDDPPLNTSEPYGCVGQLGKDNFTNKWHECTRGLIEDIQQQSNRVEEDTTSEDTGDEAFMELTYRVDPLPPNKKSNRLRVEAND